MKQEGQIILYKFPETNWQASKIRPALLIKKLPGTYDDWLLCMITRRMHQAIANFDLILSPKDTDFNDSGLRSESLIRIARLAVVDGELLQGSVGKLSSQKLLLVQSRLAYWLTTSTFSM